MNEQKQCEFVERTPIFIKQIGNFKIDESEWEGDKGAFFRYDERPCQFVADLGHKFCPRHELEQLAKIEGVPQ